MDEVKHVGLAIDPIDTPRYTSRPAASLKSMEKTNKTQALMLKSFTLERSIKKINVLQTRNYLKKPYMKTNISVTSYAQTDLIVEDKRKDMSSDRQDDLEDVSNIFEDLGRSNTRVNHEFKQSGKKESLKLTTVKNSFNNGLNTVEYE